MSRQIEVMLMIALFAVAIVGAGYYIAEAISDAIIDAAHRIEAKQ